MIYNDLWYGRNNQRVDSRLGVVNLLFDKSWIDHIVYTVYRQWCFRNIGCNDDLTDERNKTDLVSVYCNIINLHGSLTTSVQFIDLMSLVIEKWRRVILAGTMKNSYTFLTAFGGLLPWVTPPLRLVHITWYIKPISHQSHQWLFVGDQNFTRHMPKHKTLLTYELLF